jgi:hypothetical protein
MEALEGRGSIAPTHSWLDGVEWSASHPSRTLPPGKGPPVPIVQEAGWAPEDTEGRGKIPCPCRGSIAQSSSP